MMPATCAARSLLVKHPTPGLIFRKVFIKTFSFPLLRRHFPFVSSTFYFAQFCMKTALMGTKTTVSHGTCIFIFFEVSLHVKL